MHLEYSQIEDWEESSPCVLHTGCAHHSSHGISDMTLLNLRDSPDSQQDPCRKDVDANSLTQSYLVDSVLSQGPTITVPRDKHPKPTFLPLWIQMWQLIRGQGLPRWQEGSWTVRRWDSKRDLERVLIMWLWEFAFISWANFPFGDIDDPPEIYKDS